MRRVLRRIAVLAAVPLIALTGTTAAEAASGQSRASYTVWDTTGTCQITVTFYQNNGWYVQYALKNWGNGTRGCAAGAYASDSGYVGYITGGAFSTYDDGSRWVEPYVQLAGDSSTRVWGPNR